MELIIKIKSVYGEDKIYPACDTAETFANAHRQKDVFQSTDP